MNGDLIIRADATPKIGSGHLIRCLVLAQAWKELGERVIFVTFCESEVLRRRIQNEGFDLILIKSPHPNPSDLKQILSTLEANVSNFKSNSLKISKKLKPWLILDGYNFDCNYQDVIKKANCKLMIIDDLHHFSNYRADILLNQNLHAEHFQYNVHPDTRLILGTKYIILPKNILYYKTWIRPIPRTASKILITFGGSDPTDTTAKILKIIIHLSDKNLDIKIVVGPMNNRLVNYKKLLKDHSNVSLMSNIGNMQELLVWADLAIICAGGTLWECLFLGCPTVSFSANQVQKDILLSLHQKSMVHYVGDVNEVTSQDIKHSLESIVSSKYLRSELSKNGKDLVDGKGVSRIIDNMITIGGLNG